MKKLLLLPFLLICVSLVAIAQNGPAEIKKVMMLQEQAWNSGNLEAFMEGYLKSDSLLFVGSKGPTYGWKTTLEHYKKSYPDTATMGKLHFDILEIKLLSAEHYFVLGKWFLKRSVGDVGGYYTLLFKKVGGRFLIIADHSS